MTTITEIAWIAGLLEGEGCFCLGSGISPRIQLIMTDEDVVRKAARILGGSVRKRVQEGNRQIQWRTEIYSGRAFGWMQTIYPLMGSRRKNRIRELMMIWLGKLDKPSPYIRTLEIRERNKYDNLEKEAENFGQ